MQKSTIAMILQELYVGAGKLGDMLNDESEKISKEAAQKQAKRAKKRAKMTDLFDTKIPELKEAEEKFKRAQKAQKKEAKEKKARRAKAAEEAAEKRRRQKQDAQERSAEKALREQQKLQAKHDKRVAREAREAEAAAQEFKAKQARKAARQTASGLHPRQPAYVPKSFVGAPAIALKPKMDCVANGSEAIRLGGHPQLPAHIEWPLMYDRLPYHFYAQIDLASLPRTLSGPGFHFDMPQFPGQGSLFVFLHMHELSMYEDPPKVIYVPEPVAHLPERMPPPQTAKLQGQGASELWPSGIDAGKQSLRRQFVQPLAFMSTQRPQGHDQPTPVPSPQEVAAVLGAGLELTLNEDQTNPEDSKDLSDWDRYVAKTTRVPPSDHGVDHAWRFCWEHRQIQMFGHGDQVQDAAARMAGKVMLLQVGDKFGTPLNLADVAIQLWIDPQDLAAGRFDQVQCTQDCS